MDQQVQVPDMQQQVDPTVLEDALRQARELELATYQKWMTELEKAKKREKNYRKVAKRAVTIYEADADSKDIPFNILFSNTQTLSPAVYNNPPRPVVRPKDLKSQDPLVLQACKVAQRILEALMDTGEVDDTSIHSIYKQCVLEGLVAGRGIPWARYEAEINEDTDEMGMAIPSSVEHEEACLEYLPWDNFLCSYARKWEKVHWVSAIWYMDRYELKENFGEEIFQKATFKPSVYDTDAGNDRDKDGEENKPDLACVYEIWDKRTKTVYFLSDSFAGIILKQEPDPLELEGFFPCPEPLMFFRRISSMVPVPQYKFYEEQAEELNDITARIRKLIRTLRVRGGYDGMMETSMRAISELDDGELAPIPNAMALTNGGVSNLANAIWYQPMKETITALQQLYQQRDQVKQTIYEITGISDILRGATAASETATAQQIKSNWGTLRMKEAQGMVAEFARSTLRILLEIAVTKLSPDTIQQMIQIEVPREAEVQMQMQQQQMQMVMAGQPPQPPQPPPVTLEAILEKLQNDLYRNFSIDVETNSTVDIEATEDKQDFSELLNAISQFMNGFAPLVQEGILPMPAAMSILISIVRRFRLGPEVEEQLKSAVQQQQAQGQKPDPEVQKAQMEQQQSADEHRMKMQEMQMKLEIERQKLELEKQKLQMEMEYEQANHQLKMQQLRAQTMSTIMINQNKPKSGETQGNATV